MTSICLSGTELDKIYSVQSATQSEYLLSSFMLPNLHKPNDTNALNNCLISYFFTLSIIEDSLCAFCDKKYRSFDALIGNNSCYISSYIIFLIAQRYTSDSKFKQSLSIIIEEIRKTKQEIIIKTNHFKEKIKSHSLSQFLDENGLGLDLDPDCIYLAMAFGCTLAKNKNALEFEETSHDKLLEIYNMKLKVIIGRKSVQKLVKHWQKTLSIFNIKTLQSHAKTIGQGTAKLWANYISDDKYIVEDKRGRLCAPSLYSAALIYDRISKIPGSIVGLQVNLILEPKKYISRFTIYFEAQSDGSLKILDQEEFSTALPVYVFTGCRYISSVSEIDIKKTKEDFIVRDLKTMILAHEVTYPQYPKSLSAQDIKPLENEVSEEIENLKKMKGFSIEDPSDLCLVHIFVDDTITQSLSNYEPPIYLPQLDDNQDDPKACD